MPVIDPEQVTPPSVNPLDGDKMTVDAPAGISEVQRLRMEIAGLEFLSEGKYEILKLFEDVRGDFDGSEYQQGKKDGLRLALSMLGNPEYAAFNRGGGMARE